MEKSALRSTTTKSHTIPLSEPCGCLILVVVALFSMPQANSCQESANIMSGQESEETILFGGRSWENISSGGQSGESVASLGPHRSGIGYKGQFWKHITLVHEPKENVTFGFRSGENITLSIPPRQNITFATQSEENVISSRNPKRVSGHASSTTYSTNELTKVIFIKHDHLQCYQSGIPPAAELRSPRSQRLHPEFIPQVSNVTPSAFPDVSDITSLVLPDSSNISSSVLPDLFEVASSALPDALDMTPILSESGTSHNQSSITRQVAEVYTAAAQNQVNSTVLGSVLNAYERLVLSAEDITECLVKKQEMVFSAASGSIVAKNINASPTQVTAKSTYMDRLECKVVISVPCCRFWAVHISNVSCDDDIAHPFSIQQVSHRSVKTLYATYGLDSNPCYQSKKATVVSQTVYSSVNASLSLEIWTKLSHLPMKPLYLNISFTNLPEYQEILHVERTSALNGLISTPDWDGMTKYFFGMDTWVKLPIPKRHDVMVSLSHIDLEEPYLLCSRLTSWLGLYEHPTSRPLAEHCGWKLPGPSAYSLNSGFLYVRFVCYSRSSGFKLYFSFSLRSNMLVQLADSTWNCSMPQWEVFRHHFPCNIQADCLGRQDEASCPYTTEECGEGRLSIRDRCYVYIYMNTESRLSVVRPSRRSIMTWNKAERRCLREGGHLASLNSYREHLDIVEFLSKYTYVRAFIGMVSTALQSLIYRNKWKTLDNTINHYTKCFPQHRSCFDSVQGGAFLHTDKIIHIARDCRIGLIETDILCDLATGKSAPTTHRHNTLSVPSTSPLPFDYHQLNRFEWNVKSYISLTFYISCLSGHVTHAFLACDFQSACWARDFSSYVSCQSPLDRLPPAMMCDNGVQYVPYTLVCDHRPDCDDGSDEDFCVFTPCNFLTEFKCPDGRECLPSKLWCDGVAHCRAADDERDCEKKKHKNHHYPKNRDCTSSTLAPVILTVDSLDGSKLKSLKHEISMNGVLVSGTLVNATLVNVTVSQAVVNEALDGMTLVTGVLENGTLISGTLVRRNHETGRRVVEELVTRTLIGGVKVRGLLAKRSQKKGLFVQGTLVKSSTLFCPASHFHCTHDDYCIPVFMRCNGLYDCPSHEDEVDCDTYQCPGFYRCRRARMCVHAHEVCDSMPHCPQNDDELLCDLSCPYGCTCYGLAFVCSRVVPIGLYPQLRYLDASGSGITVHDIKNNTMLISLSLVRSQVVQWGPINLPNLRNLDLSVNNITNITSHFLRHLPNLQHLALAHNPLSSAFLSEVTTKPLRLTLRSLDLSGVFLPELNVSALDVYDGLHTLNLTGCHLDRLLGDGLPLEHLRVLDLRGCPLTYFSRNVFRGLGQLVNVLADNYKLCCPATLPEGFNLINCQAPFNEISSCKALLRSDFFRICLCLFAASSCIGNLLSLVFRIKVGKNKRTTGFDTFVSNLCVSDFLMGIYLSIIGIADRLYVGVYLWNDVTWRHSSSCQTAGFLSLLSSEVSAFIIFLITLDRLIVLRFPFSHLHFNATTALIVSVLIWTISLVIAAVPLMPGMSHWHFYSQTGICLPLPITNTDFKGRVYSFSVMIVVNFVLFVLIALGQLLIFLSVQKHKMSVAGDSVTALNKKHTLARRLITVAVSDFLCWFPVGLVGMMAANGIPIPGTVNVAMAIFVLPLNSAINPFLYTLNIVLEKRRLLRENRLRQFLMSQIDVQNASGRNTAQFGDACTQQEAERGFQTMVEHRHTNPQMHFSVPSGERHHYPKN